MNLNKIVNKINGTVIKSKIRTCGYLGQTKVKQIREYPEIHLEDLLLALNKKNDKFSYTFDGDFLKIRFMRMQDHVYFIKKFGNTYIQLDLSQPLSKQKKRIIKQLIEILS